MGLTNNDETRMTRHQLAARIQQMEATAHRNSAVGAPADRHRPMEDRRRHEKISRYQAELDRRIAADAAAETAADTAAAATRSQAPADARVCDACEGTLATGSAYTARGCPQCHGTGLTTTQEQAPVTRPPANGRDFSSYREPDDEVKHARQAEESNQAAIRSEAAETRAEIAYAPSERPIVEMQPRMTPTPVPPPPALAVECPQCNAQPGQRCTNYQGQHCAPHGSRNTAAREARRLDQGKHPAARPAPTPEPATLHNARITTTLSQAAAAFAPQPRPEHKDLNPLEIEVLELVRTHSSGVVIDAAWKAANILHPWSHR